MGALMGMRRGVPVALSVGEEFGELSGQRAERVPLAGGPADGEGV